MCDDDALRPLQQTADTVEELRRNWDFWLDLPNTDPGYIRVDDLEEGVGALETILLDKNNYSAFLSGDGACLGCGEKTVVHLFVATIVALMQPRVKRFVAQLEELIEQLESHIRLKMMATMDVSNTALIDDITSQMTDHDLTLSAVAANLEKTQGGEPIDRQWLRRVTGLLAKLKNLKWRYSQGTTGRGRAPMGLINATGCSSVWGSTYPYNPYPFPWANHLFQDTASMALGVFEGHMAKMAEGFKAVRLAELELAGKYQPAEHDEFFSYFNWHQFSDEEWLLCPPVVALGGDGAMYDIGFQNLSRALISGKPVKVLVLDTQVYSNTGGQACTSGFLGQISDMAQFGKVTQGKQEIRKEIGLIGMAHRNSYILQGAISNPGHMIEGFIEGLMSRRPALFNLYTPCQPEHGIGDDMATAQAKLAVESRAYPLFRYNPESGKVPAECFELGGNPAMDQDWPVYTLTYLENGRKKTMDVPLTFADFALTEARFRKHFRHAPADSWHENMIPLAEFLNLDDDEREGKFPFVWTVNREQQLNRLLVSSAIVESSEDRRDFWTLLKALAGQDQKPEPLEAIENQVRSDIIGRITSALMSMAGGDDQAAPAVGNLLQQAQTAHLPEETTAAPAGEEQNGYIAPWLETELCTSCDECININSAIFAYNEDKKAFIKDADAGPYSDVVKAAEKCTARIIHPGLPGESSEKNIEKWIKRAEKYNR